MLSPLRTCQLVHPVPKQSSAVLLAAPRGARIRRFCGHSCCQEKARDTFVFARQPWPVAQLCHLTHHKTNMSGENWYVWKSIREQISALAKFLSDISAILLRCDFRRIELFSLISTQFYKKSLVIWSCVSHKFWWKLLIIIFQLILMAY